jgi:hypothetical protein
VVVVVVVGFTKRDGDLILLGFFHIKLN